MIVVKEHNGAYEARFIRNDYLSISGLGDSRAEALVNLRTEMEAHLITEEAMVTRMAEAIDSIDGLLDAALPQKTEA